MTKFHKVVYRHYSGEVKNFAVLCSKFIQDATYQLVSELAEFCRKYDKNILAYFFLGHSVVTAYMKHSCQGQ